MVGETKLNCNTLWGKWICLQGCKTVKGILTTKKSVDWHGLSKRLRGTVNANYLNTLHLSVRGVSLGPRRMYRNEFSIDYINKVYHFDIICI